MPSKAFSNSELGESHGMLLRAKKERESDDELEDQIKETNTCVYDHMHTSYKYIQNI